MPEGQDKEQQEDKKKTLLEKFKKGDETEVQSFLQATYASQRAMLNNRGKDKLSVPDIIKNHWPHLGRISHYFDHATRLFQRDIVSDFEKNLSEKGPKIWRFLDTKSLGVKNKKSCPENMKKIAEEINKATEASSALESKMPKSICIFQILSLYFKEESLITLLVNILN